jgi:hypothetical protein
MRHTWTPMFLLLLLKMYTILGEYCPEGFGMDTKKGLCVQCPAGTSSSGSNPTNAVTICQICPPGDMRAYYHALHVLYLYLCRS